jgi:hypothetical protein
VNVLKITALKKFVNGKSKPVPYAGDRSEGICSGTQMRNLPEEFQGMAFFLKRLTFRRGRT